MVRFASTNDGADTGIRRSEADALAGQIEGAAEKKLVSAGVVHCESVIRRDNTDSGGGQIRQHKRRCGSIEC